MDTSKKNIKMCEKAKEIQKGFNEEVVFCLDQNKQLFITDKGSIICGTYIPNSIWLPSQDQLQEMVDNDFIGFSQQILEWNSMNPSIFYRMSPNASGEQLWLVFVMKEKYNKVWTGEDWESQKG